MLMKDKCIGPVHYFALYPNFLENFPTMAVLKICAKGRSPQPEYRPKYYGQCKFLKKNQRCGMLP